MPSSNYPRIILLGVTQPRGKKFQVATFHQRRTQGGGRVAAESTDAPQAGSQCPAARDATIRLARGARRGAFERDAPGEESMAEQPTRARHVREGLGRRRMARRA